MQDVDRLACMEACTTERWVSAVRVVSEYRVSDGWVNLISMVEFNAGHFPYHNWSYVAREKPDLFDNKLEEEQ